MEAAAQTYFSTGADRLSLTQAALLAGLIRAPAAYDPFRHPRAARARRASVLARMERNGHLRRAVRVRAAATPLGLRPGDPATAATARARRRGEAARPNSAATQHAPWFVGWVLDQLLDPADRRFDVLGTSRKARTDRVFTGGLRITTTVDLKAQAAAERAVAAVAGDVGATPTARWWRSSRGRGRSGRWWVGGAGGTTPGSGG